MKRTKWLAALMAVVLSASLFTGCGAKEKTKVNVAALNGPTGIGMVQLMDNMDQGKADEDYSFTLAGAPDELTGKITSGEVDIAALPTNLAATLYQKTQGKVTLIALNTLGTMYVVEKGNTVNGIQDLNGKTVVSAGQGSTPQYTLDHLFKQNNVQATVEYKSEHAEVASALLSGQNTLAVLPEPYVTNVMAKDPEVRVAVDLNEAWKQSAGGSELVMGCLVVRTEFLQEHKDAVDTFLKEYKESVDYVNNNVDQAAELVAKYGILPSAEVAKSAIPKCNIVCITGAEMKPAIEGYFQVLYEANAKSVGGNMPDDAFYYEK